jgi:hypothetical protein
MNRTEHIYAMEFAKLLCPALGLEINRVRRLVLDLQIESLPIVYVELIGDKRLLEINQTFDGIKFDVKYVESEQ